MECVQNEKSENLFLETVKGRRRAKQTFGASGNPKEATGRANG